MPTLEDCGAVWIETKHVADENRTEWRVMLHSEVQIAGEVPEDPSGERAYNDAHEWVARNAMSVLGWKHAVDRVSELRPRTTTAQPTTLRLYGWADCVSGERQPVMVTPVQMRELESGLLPCPVCGESCGVRLVPTDEVRTIALAWNGTRWHACPRF